MKPAWVTALRLCVRQRRCMRHPGHQRTQALPVLLHLHSNRVRLCRRAWQAASARVGAAAWLSRPLRSGLSVCASPSAQRPLASRAASTAAYLQPPVDGQISAPLAPCMPEPLAMGFCLAASWAGPLRS